MRKQGPSEYKRILRKDMLRKIEPAATLDHSSPHSESAQASAHRAFVDWKTITANLGRQKFHTTPAATVGSLGEIAIVQDDGSLTLSNGELNYPAIWDQVRQAYGDQFDFLTFFTDFSVPFSYSFWSAIYFNTQGISPDTLLYDIRSDWNTTRLQGFHFINPGHIDLMGVYLQEFGHQWCSYVYFADSPDSEYVYVDLLLDGEPGHWDHYMDDEHSPMNYDFQFTPYMSTHWRQRDNDPSLFDYHATEGIEYCDLDLYLMGLLPPEEVRPFYFIANPQQVGPQTWSGQRVEVTVEHVINAMGPRQAPADLRTTDFRNAWILVTRDASSGAKMAARLDNIRQDFEVRYRVATRCRGRVDTRLS